MKVEKTDITKEILRENYYRTALPKSLGPSAPIQKFEKYRKKHNMEINSVIDYGAGHQRDKEFCIQKYGNYVPYDIFPDFKVEQPQEVLNRKYDLVITNYVLNIIIPEDRMYLIRAIEKYLLEGSIILLAVRPESQERDIKDNWIPYEDGWVTTRLTFQHFFSKKEISSLFDSISEKLIDLKRGTYILINK
ncbi:MAG: hypothetical protein GF311_20605 [Candidatus Lokiarchaeota archaeon]|nr:hypothetical protein [Candidatus Lokiarchaeota archaeon]